MFKRSGVILFFVSILIAGCASSPTPHKRKFAATVPNTTLYQCFNPISHRSVIAPQTIYPTVKQCPPPDFVRSWTVKIPTSPTTVPVTTTTKPVTPTTSTTIPGTTAYTGPLVIRAGGVYSGNWESNNPSVPAVTIETADPVTIQNCNIRGKYDLIRTSIDHTKVTVQNCNGYGLNPGAVGQPPGRFFFAEVFDRATIEHNYLNNTAGIRLATYAGNGTTDTVKIRYNRSANIDGRWSNGAGYSTGSTDFDRVSFVQFVSNVSIPGVEISWNEDINQPSVSRVEDNINIFETSGTSGSHILIHDNYIQGAYAALPESQDFTGGGIDTDGGSGGSRYVDVYNNQIVSTSNYGIGLVAGANNVFYNNRMVSSGLLANGHQIHIANVGAIDWNAYSFSGFTNNIVRDNVIGWYQPANSTQNNTYFPACPSACTGNAALHSGVITLADEAAEKTTWDKKVSTEGVILGP